MKTPSAAERCVVPSLSVKSVDAQPLPSAKRAVSVPSAPPAHVVGVVVATSASLNAAKSHSVEVLLELLSALLELLLEAVELELLLTELELLLEAVELELLLEAVELELLLTVLELLLEAALLELLVPSSAVATNSTTASTTTSAARLNKRVVEQRISRVQRD